MEERARPTVRRRKSLTLRISRTFILLVAAALAIVGGILIAISRRQNLQSVFVGEQKTAHEIALVISDYINNARDDLTLIGHSWPLATMPEAEVKKILEGLLALRGTQLSSLTLLNGEGRERVKISQYRTYLPSELSVRAQSELYTKAISGESYIGPIELSPESGLLSVEVAVPLSSEHGFNGALVAEVNVTSLWQKISGIEIGQTGYAYLVDSAGHFVAHQEPAQVLKRYGEDMSDLPPVAAFTYNLPPDNRSAYEYTGLTGQHVVGFFMPVEATDWAVITELPTKEAYADITRMQWYLVGMIVLGMFVAGGISLVISRRLVRPILGLAETASAVASGDLEQTVTVEHEDEIGVLAAAFNSMTEQLRGLIRDLEERVATERASVREYANYMDRVAQGHLSARIPLDDREDSAAPLVQLGHKLNDMVASLQRMITETGTTANELGSSAAGILAAATQQATGASEQSAAIAQASSTIDEVRAIAQQTAQRAQAVADMAQRTVSVSEAGQQAVADTIDGMQVVKNKVEAIASNILYLSEQTEAIGQIIATVRAIAAHSNLLALNAAVEAARAGEAGRGFAVVAQEVRNLAEQSRTATEQVRDILTEIQQGVEAAVAATEEGRAGADEGMRLTGEAGQAIDQMAESVLTSTQSALQIATAADQQLAGMEQIATAMENIHQTTAESVSSARQLERTAGELNDLAGRLRELVGQYQI